MIEPTETESRETLDRFVVAMEQIYDEALSHPEIAKTAPHTLGLGRVDEVAAARHPILRWQPRLWAAARGRRTQPGGLSRVRAGASRAWPALCRAWAPGASTQHPS